MPLGMSSSGAIAKEILTYGHGNGGVGPRQWEIRPTHRTAKHFSVINMRLCPQSSCHWKARHGISLSKRHVPDATLSRFSDTSAQCWQTSTSVAARCKCLCICWLNILQLWSKRLICQQCKCHKMYEQSLNLVQAFKAQSPTQCCLYHSMLPLVHRLQ